MHTRETTQSKHWIPCAILLPTLLALSGCHSSDMATNAATSAITNGLDHLTTQVNHKLGTNFADVTKRLDDNKKAADAAMNKAADTIKVSDDERRTFGLAISNLVTRADAILTLQSNYLQLQTNLAGLKASVESLTGSNSVLRSKVEQLYTRYQISTNQIAKLESKADDVEKERKRQWEDSLKLTVRLEQVRASELRNQDWHRQLIERERQLQMREGQINNAAPATSLGSPASGQGKGIPPKAKPSK